MVVSELEKEPDLANDDVDDDDDDDFDFNEDISNEDVEKLVQSITANELDSGGVSIDHCSFASDSIHTPILPDL